LTVRNKSAETLTNVRPYGWAGRSKTDQARALNFPAITELSPGQSWTQVLHVKTPAPHLGEFYWEVTVSGAGVPVHDELVTRSTPWLLIAIVLLIIGDLAVMGVRWIRRRTAESPTESATDAPRRVASPTG
jgi:hypothetical protein